MGDEVVTFKTVESKFLLSRPRRDRGIVITRSRLSDHIASGIRGQSRIKSLIRPTPQPLKYTLNILH